MCERHRVSAAAGHCFGAYRAISPALVLVSAVESSGSYNLCFIPALSLAPAQPIAARHITVICNAIERSEPLSEGDSVVLVERILAVLAR